MAENPIQGFQTNSGVKQYDYNALANKPTLITQAEINAAITAAKKYTDEQISKIDITPTVQIELDTSLSVQGKAADAKAVGDALGEKLDTTELNSAINTALEQAKESGDFNGPQGPQGEPGVYTKVNGIAPDETGNVILTAADVGALPSAGGDMTGAINMNGQKLSGLNDPTEKSQAANKGYTDTKADLPKMVSGTVISMDDASDAELQGLRIYGKTTQDDTPTPEAPVELVSVGDGGSVSVTVCGKNLLDVNSVTKHYYNADGIMTPHDYFALFGWIPVKQGNQLTFTAKYIGVEPELLRWAVFDKKKNFISRHTSPAKAEKIVLEAPANGFVRVFLNTTNYDISTAQLTYGGTASEFEAYNGGYVTISTPNELHGIPVTSGGNYTDASGQQWICDEVNFDRSVRVIRLKQKRVSPDLNWTYSSAINRFFVVDKDYKLGDFNVKIPNVICTHFKAGKGADDKIISYINDSSHGYAFRYSALNGDVSAWRNFLTNNEVYIIGELNSTIEIPLTTDEISAYSALHTYKPNTIVYNDAGAHTEVGYYTPNATMLQSDIAKVLDIAKAEANTYTDTAKAEANTYTDTAVRKAAPRNLLDNSDFRNPVNQRGQTNYSLSAWGGYCIDRWTAFSDGATVTIGSGGLTLSGGIYQPISSDIASMYNGKVLTLAVKIAGTVYCCSGEVNQIGTWHSSARSDTPYGYINFETENNNMMFVVINNSTTPSVVEWAALYEGSYTAETFPEYQPKGYGAELVECQRYYYNIADNIINGVANVSTQKVIALLPLPTTMRIIHPTVTLKTALWAYDGAGGAYSLTLNNSSILVNGLYVEFSATIRIYSAVSIPDVNMTICADL